MRYYVNFQIMACSYSGDAEPESRTLLIEAQDLESLFALVAASGPAVAASAERALSDFVLARNTKEAANE